MKALLLICLGASPFLLRTFAAAEVEGLPPIAPRRDAKFSIPQEKTLTNGLRIIVIDRPALPLVSATLYIKSGAEADPSSSPGLAAFTAAMLTQGTATRSATEIASEVEALGASLKGSATWDATGIELTTLSSKLEPAFALLADITRHPQFAAEEVERLRLQALDELRLALEEPGKVARLVANRLILGQGLYAHATQGTPAAVKRFSRSEIATFHGSHYSAGQAVLIMAGDLRAEAAFGLAEKFLGDWVAAPVGKAAPLPAFAPVTKPRVVIVDTAGAGQAAVVVGCPGITRGAADYFIGELANAVLGGGYSARLNQEIRVKRGLSYGASSALSTLRAGGLCLAHCQTKNASVPEVVKLMQAEFQRLGTEPVAPDFLSARRAVLLGNFARGFETNEGYVTGIADFALHDLPIDSANQYAGKIEKVTTEEVQAFASKYLAPAGLSIAIVGEAREFLLPLKKLLPSIDSIRRAELDLDSPSLHKTGRNH